VKREERQLSLSLSVGCKNSTLPLFFGGSFPLYPPSFSSLSLRLAPEREAAFSKNGKVIVFLFARGGEKKRTRASLDLLPFFLSLSLLSQLCSPSLCLFSSEFLSLSLSAIIPKEVLSLELVERHHVDRLDVVALAVPDELLCWLVGEFWKEKKRRKRKKR